MLYMRYLKAKTPRRYWSDLKSEGSELYEKIVQLKLRVKDGKFRENDTLNTEGVFRIIESISMIKRLVARKNRATV